MNLDKVEGMRCILGMAETVVTGCADGYARMAEKPAMTLLHCGPGFANGIANLHNARRANTPMVNIVGDQATYHRPFDAPLTADTEGLCRAVSHWIRTSGSVKQVANDGADAVQAAGTPPGQIATPIVPADIAWGEGGIPAVPISAAPRSQVAPEVLRTVLQALRSGEPTMLLLNGQALNETHEVLAPSGTLCIADLDAEDGSFHGAGFDGHHGFDRVRLGAQARAAGFTTVAFTTAYVMRKASGAVERSYPIFLLVATA